jgi:adenosylhomocysteine nucleosidase
MMLGFVTGLTAEASLLRRVGGRVAIGGGTPDGALRAAETLVRDESVSALVSFGLAGGLDPGLPAGTLLVPRMILEPHGATFPCDIRLTEMFGGTTTDAMVGGGHVAVTSEHKRALFASTGAAAIDLESVAVARVAAEHGLGFAALRAIADPAGRHLPPAALVALGPEGRIALIQILKSVLRRPGQIPDLIALGREAAAARRTLHCALESYRSRVSTTGT